MDGCCGSNYDCFHIRKRWGVQSIQQGRLSQSLKTLRGVGLVHKVVDSVKKNLQLDWTKKEDARAAIRLAVKKEMRGKVAYSELDKLLKEVIERAEGQFRDWPLEA